MVAFLLPLLPSGEGRSGQCRKQIASGCKTDAPGSFIEWLCKQTAVHAYEMPGQRFDVGSIEGYERIRKEYRGITKKVC